MHPLITKKKQGDPVSAKFDLEVGLARKIGTREWNLPESVKRAVHQGGAGEAKSGAVFESAAAGPNGENQDQRCEPDWKNADGEQRLANGREVRRRTVHGRNAENPVGAQEDRQRENAARADDRE